MVRALVVVSLLLVACKDKQAPPAVHQRAEPAEPPSKLGEPVRRHTIGLGKIETLYDVILPAGADLKAFEKQASDHAAGFAVEAAQFIETYTDDQLELLTRNMKPEEIAKLRASAGVITVRGSSSDAKALARKLAAAARDLADSSHGWVVDPEVFEIYGADAFHDHVPGDKLDVRKLIRVNAVMGENVTPYLDTAGLRRYGIPELYVKEASRGQTTAVTHLINGAAQFLLDSGDLATDGELAIDFKALGWDVGMFDNGSGKAVWKLRWAKEPDADEQSDFVIQLVPPDGPSTEAVAKMIDGCFGGAADTTTTIAADDPELLATGKKARADLGKLQRHFANGVPLHERLTVKAKFTAADGQVEWMWVDVVAFKRNAIAGTLANDPEYVTTLKEGSKVTVKLAEVADYLHERADGTRAGGYSIELMKKRGIIPADTEY